MTIARILLFLCACSLSAQLPVPFNPQRQGASFPPVSGTRILGTFNVTSLPSSPAVGDLALATDGTSGSECTTGGSALINWCRWTGSAWALASSGSTGGSPAFSAIGAGTNTHALVIGTGGSFTTSGSGTINATSLGGNLAATYAPLASPSFTGTVAIGTSALINDTSTVYLTPSFVGSGLNDLAPGGVYTGGATSPNATFEVVIDATGSPDTFKWRKNGGSYTTGVPITGAAQTLSNGVQITFGADSGHTLADAWTVRTATTSLSTATFNGFGRSADILADQASIVSILNTADTIHTTGLNINLTIDPTTQSPAQAFFDYGVQMVISDTTGDVTPKLQMTGFYGATYHQAGTAAVTTLQGIYGVAYDGAANSTSVYGSYFNAIGGATQYGSWVGNTTGSNTNNSFGYYVSKPSGTPATRNAAYFNENMTGVAGAGKDFAWYSEGGTNHLETGEAATVGVEIEAHAGQTADLWRTLASDGTTVENRLTAGGNLLLKGLTTTGAAGSKKTVCVDTATGQLYASSTGTDCSN